jgi:lipopolysaccharide/colanic/teichoic acid biosynthesis glycosyltransferase
LWLFRNKLCWRDDNPERPSQARLSDRPEDSYPIEKSSNRKRVRPGVTGWARVRVVAPGMVERARYHLEIEREFVNQT